MATKAVQNGRSPVDKQKQRNDKAEESYPTGRLAFLTRDKSKSTQKIYSHYRRTYLQKHTKTKSSGTGSMITLATSVKGCFFIGEVQYVCRSTFRCGSLEQVEAFAGARNGRRREINHILSTQAQFGQHQEVFSAFFIKLF